MTDLTYRLLRKEAGDDRVPNEPGKKLFINLGLLCQRARRDGTTKGDALRDAKFDHCADGVQFKTLREPYESMRILDLLSFLLYLQA